MTLSSPNHWIDCYHPNPQAAFRLFCFPYAGSGPMIFRGWQKKLPAAIEVCPVQLPGRARRMKEEPYRSLEALRTDLTEGLLPWMDRPFGFFGHSMGALLGFEVSRELRRRVRDLPQCLWLSAYGAPQIVRSRRKIHALADAEFLEELRRLKGTPPEVLKHQELMRLVMPMVRADLEVIETYEYLDEPPLNCPLHAWGAAEDEEVLVEELKAWRFQTEKEFSLKLFPGDHFYLQSHTDLVLETLREEVLEFL